MEEFEQVEVGEKVKHVKFGQGTVTFKAGDGENTKVIVKFQGEAGEKKLMLKYAKLKKAVERATLVAEPEAAEAKQA
jgi:DNA helicase II / ATP-dependent DNA helicase PcrA